MAAHARTQLVLPLLFATYDSVTGSTLPPDLIWNVLQMPYLLLLW